MILQVETINILEISEGIIGHQVHVQHPDGRRPGTFGKGLAYQIRKKYPYVFERYKADAENWELGRIQIVNASNTINNKLRVANLAGQLTYGNGLQTDYDALSICLDKLHKWAKFRGQRVYLPYGLGCGNAGGDWEIVYSIIDSLCPNAIICKLPD